MTKTEEEMLEFLTRKDNLPHVIEIVRQRDEIEKRILMQFWNDLKYRIQQDVTAPVMSDGPLKLRLTTEEDSWDIELHYTDRKLEESDEENLGYSVFLFVEDDDTVDLSYGVQWQSLFKKVPRKLQRLAPVTKLMKELDEMEFEKPQPNWSLAGWRSSGDCNKYDFLTRIVLGDAESVLQEVTTNFCALVKKTRDLVMTANKEIAAASSK